MARGKDQRPQVVPWARRVSPEERHDLQEIEDRVRAQAPATGHTHALTKAAIIAMIVGTTVFFASDSGRYQFDFDPQFELPVAFICFLIVCAFQAKVFTDWWANGRVCSVDAMWASGFVGATGAYVCWQALGRVDGNPVLAWAAFVPAAAACAAAVIAFMLSLFSRRPHLWRPGWNGPPTATVATLPRDIAEPLRRDREEAMKILVERGLLDLDDTELRRLADAPLGLLDKI